MKIIRLIMAFVLMMGFSTSMRANDLIGEWKADTAFVDISLNGANMNVYLEFKDDSTMNYTFGLDLPVEQNALKMIFVLKLSLPAIYHVEADTLFISSENELKVDMDVNFPELDAEQSATLKEMMKPQMEELKSQLMNMLGELDDEIYKKSIGTTRFSINGDKLNLETKNQLFTRVKSIKK